MGKAMVMARSVVAWPYFGLCVVLVVLGAWHLLVMGSPGTPIFDERYYADESASVLVGSGPVYPEVGPLARVLYAGAFQYGVIGGRLLSLAFGLFGVVVFWLLCRELFRSVGWATVGAALLGTERVYFVHSQIAMPDMGAYVFGMAALVVWVRKLGWESGQWWALGFMVKVTALAFVPVFFIDSLVRRSSGRLVMVVASSVGLVALGLPVLVAAAGGGWQWPWEVVGGAWGRLAGVTGTQAGSSQPWSWFVEYGRMAYSVHPDLVVRITPVLFAVAVFLVVWAAVRAAGGYRAGQVACSWIFGTMAFYVVLALVLGRTTYLYYVLPVLGGLILAAVDVARWAWSRGKVERWILGAGGVMWMSGIWGVGR